MKHHVSSTLRNGTHHDHFGIGLLTSFVVIVVVFMSLLLGSPIAQIYQGIAEVLK
jgi:hypothetical protein